MKINAFSVVFNLPAVARNFGGLLLNQMKKLIYVTLFILNFSIYSQNVTIKVSNLSELNAKLYSVSGEKLTFIDSFESVQNIFTFKLKNENGLYRIAFDKTKFLNFVNDDEDIEIKTDVNFILDSLKIIKSESNKIYYKFLKLNKDYKTRSELLNVILTHYPKDDDYYSITNSKLESIQKEYDNFINIESQANPKSFIAGYIKSSQLPIIPQNISQQEQLSYLKKHALDNVNFDDARLIYSDMFTNKSIEYLTYFRNPQLPKDLLEQEFMKAVDTLLNKAKINQLVYQHITEYLIDGFKKFGFDNIIDYIIENYVIKDDLCLDEKLETALDRRIKQSKNLQIGDKVPNIILPEINGNEIDLSKIESKEVLLVFYASWCPHCQDLLPKIMELASKIDKDKLQVLAISLDTSKTDWLNFIQNNKLGNLLNVSDLKGWNGKSANDYFIYATPTMFLINSEKKIISKPLTFDELKFIFNEN